MEGEKLFRETILRVLLVGMVNISINKICEPHLAFLLRGNWKTDYLDPRTKSIGLGQTNIQQSRSVV